jgi:hypothetical protein
MPIECAAAPPSDNFPQGKEATKTLQILMSQAGQRAAAGQTTRKEASNSEIDKLNI